MVGDRETFLAGKGWGGFYIWPFSFFSSWGASCINPPAIRRVIKEKFFAGVLLG